MADSPDAAPQPAAQVAPRRAGGALPVRVVLVAWLAVVFVASAAGLLARLRPPVPQLVVLALTLGAIAAERIVPAVRAHLATARTRVLVAFHLVRFVGFAFLDFAARGVLPRDFAVPAGWGDIAVAALAALLLVAGGDPRGPRRPLWLAWNALGLLDLAFVVINAARHALADPAAMDAMLRLPMSLLPFFLVPILLASHVWIARRLLSREGGAAAA